MSSDAVIERADGTAKVYIFERDDGLYQYSGETEIQGNEEERVYWKPTHRSGIYASDDEAERVAFDNIPWLCQQKGTLSDSD
jgi:hypothetical protein